MVLTGVAWLAARTVFVCFTRRHRHAHAALLVANGTSIKVVTERLGHAHPCFTMQTPLDREVALELRNESTDEAEGVRAGRRRWGVDLPG